MKAKNPVTEKRKQYTAEYKRQDLIKVDRDGMKATAHRQTATNSAWMGKPQHISLWINFVVSLFPRHDNKIWITDG